VHSEDLQVQLEVYHLPQMIEIVYVIYIVRIMLLPDTLGKSTTTSG
jgi:hypothetical protein